MSSIIPINLSLSYNCISATPTLPSFASCSDAKALSASTAKLSSDVLSGVVAR